MRTTDRMTARNDIAQRQGTWSALLTAAVMLALGVLTSSAMAASTDANGTQGQVQPLTKGSKLIGKDIVDAQNKKLGEIKDMAIDLGNNRIDYVVVSSGGILGIGDKLYAVPAQVFGPYREDHDLVLNGSPQVLKASPVPNKNWLSAIDRNSLNSMYQKAGAAMPTDNGASPQTVTATDMIGMGILTQQGEKAAADVKDLAVNMQDGRVPLAILSVGGPSGMNTKYVAVPTAALSKGPVRERLYISTPAQALNSAPEIDKDHWDQALADPSLAARVYVSYGVTPYWTQKSDTAQGSGQTQQQQPQGMGGTREEPSTQKLERRGTSQ